MAINTFSFSTEEAEARAFLSVGILEASLAYGANFRPVRAICIVRTSR